MRQRLLTIALMLAGLLTWSGPAAAQHSIDIQKRTQQGEYFEALSAYDRLPKRTVTMAARVAAGKAAWGLSLPDRAIEEFDAALRSADLTPADRSRLLLSRGLIEFQEGRYQTAILFADKLSTFLDKGGPYRAKAWLLWAESLAKTNAYGSAEQKYRQALAEAGEEDQAEIRYLLGQCQLKLGNLKSARENLEQIPFSHERAPEAIKALAQIALEEGRMNDAGFWLNKGRSDFPEAFIDSWVDYALTQVAIRENNQTEVFNLQLEAAKKYPPSDHWITLLNAAVEAYAWQPEREVVHAKS